MWPLIRRISRTSRWLGPAEWLKRAESTIATEQRALPLLSKMKADLKTAMKAKDKARLDVLRALMAETTNAAKASKPIETDVQFLALLRKRIAAGKDAAAQFHAANRTDLFEKEMTQVGIMDEYASQVRVLGQEQIDTTIKQTIERLRSNGQPNEGSIMRDLFGPSGQLTNEPVEKGAVARRVKELVHT